VAVVNGQVLFACSSGDVDVYDSGTGAWSVASLSAAHRRPAVAVVGTQALFAGGLVGSVGLSDVVDIYDSVTGEWSTATLSEARQDAAVAVVGSQVLFAGGIIERVQHTAAVDIYDSATGR
jgi:hypothetical protein